MAHQPHYIQMSDGSLLINPVQFEDRGQYVCRASTGKGPGAEISKEVRLRVSKMEEVCGRRSQWMGNSGSGSGSQDDEEEERSHVQQLKRRRRRKRVAYGEVVAGAREWPWQVCECACV